MRLTIIGSGDAFNSGGSLHSCYLLEHARGRLMLECGPGVLAGLKRLRIDTQVPDAVLVSHHHGDHFGGVPYLFLEYTFANVRARSLTVAGPSTIEQHVCTLYRALYGDIQCRELSFPVRYQEMVPGRAVDLAGFRCTPFQVPHNAEPMSLGYRIESPEGTLLFSGDSAWTDDFIEKSQGVDLFLCECCSIDPVIPVHTSYQELLEHRHELGCKRMLLTHLGADVLECEPFELERARDGLVIEI